MHVQPPAHQVLALAFVGDGQGVAVPADLHQFAVAQHGPQAGLKLPPLIAAQAQFADQLLEARRALRLPLDVLQDLPV